MDYSKTPEYGNALRVRDNIRKMMEQGAAPEEVDSYVTAEGVTPDAIKEAGRVESVRAPLAGVPGGEDAPTPPPYEKPGVMEDVAKSAVYRGVPETLAAANPVGIVLNATRGISDLVRWGAGKIYKAIEGEELPHYTDNPIPTSHDVLKEDAKTFLNQDLYEPKTTAGEYANTAAQFATGSGAARAGLKTIINRAIPAAVVSETAGQATKGTDLEAPARFVGALAGGAIVPTGGKLLGAPKIDSMNADEIKALSQATYKEADNKGGILKPDLTNKFIDEVQKMAPQTGPGKLLSGDSASSKVSEIIQQFRDKHLTLKSAEEIDQALSDKIDDFYVDGRLKAQGKKLLDIQDKFREVINDASPNDVLGGKDGFDALAKGRELWAAQTKLRDIEKIFTRAESMDNPATAIKNGFNTLQNSASRMRGFNAAEKAAIASAAKSGLMTDIAKTFGSRLIPILAASTGGGLTGTAAAAATAMASRGLATKIQMAKGQKVAGLVASRALPATAAAPPQPALTYQPGMPLSAMLNQAVSRQ